MGILNKIKHPLKQRRRLINKSNAWRITDIFTITAMAIALVALLALIYFYVRPVPTVDIKVPVATDKAEYQPGEEVSGIFFGEVYYSGKVDIVRDVFCKDYRGRILTDQGDEIFSGASVPAKLEGTTRRIGNLPSDVPVGQNCVIQFVNTYHIETPFGDRVISNAYYTQNFMIVEPRPETPPHTGSDERDGVGGAEPLNPGGAGQPQEPTPQEPPQPEPQQPRSFSEPVQPPRACLIDIGPIKLLCS